MIHVENLTKEFRTPKKYSGFGGAVKSFFSHQYEVKRAVDNMNFEIAPGELVGYIGVNGAGKSTTIKMMTGILWPTSGRCEVFGVEASRNRRQNAKNIGVVFGQRSQLWWDLPVSESFSILQKIYDVPKPRFAENLAYFKELLELDEFFTTPVRNLSLGQKMRADFAAAMLHDPKVIFLDEPTIGLDIMVKDRIRKAIRDINKQKGTAVILTTHDLADIEEVCDRIIVIDEGKKLFDGSIDALKRNFGRRRGVRFELKSTGTDTDESARSILAGFNPDHIEVTASVATIDIRYDSNKMEAGDLIKAVMAAREIRDIAIEEPRMEDIVKEIYSGKIKPKELNPAIAAQVAPGTALHG